MALFYVEVRQVREKKELTVPERWGMYTARGNREITKMATRLFDAVNGGNDEDDLYRFFRDYKVLVAKYRKGMEEAGDTDVREQVWSFGEKIARVTGDDPDRAWDRAEEYVYRQRKAAREAGLLAREAGLLAGN